MSLSDSPQLSRETDGPKLLGLFFLPALLVLGTGPLPLFSKSFLVTLLSSLGLIAGFAALLFQVRNHLGHIKIRLITLGLITLQSAALYCLLFSRQHTNLAYAVLGVWALSFGYSALLALFRWLLQSPSPITGMAKLTLREAFRLRTALTLVVVAVALIPLLPGLLSEDATPANKLRSFLHTSLNSLEALLVLLCLTISCGVMHRDIQERQIHLTLTKPVSRLSYLLGRWLGTVLMCAALLIVTGGAILLQMSLSTRGDVTQVEKREIENEVLTARRIVPPELPTGEAMEELRAARLDHLQRANPIVWGEPGDPITSALEISLENEIIQAWFQMDPGQPKTYYFENLSSVKQTSDYVTLRYQPRIDKGGSEGFLYMRFLVQGQPFPLEYGRTSRGTEVTRPKTFTVLNKEMRELDIPTRLIDDEGNLAVTMRFSLPPQVMLNLAQTSGLTFDAESGITLFYPEDGYLMNYFRGMLILLAKIIFYTALGIMITSRFSFQTAVMAGLIAYAINENATFLISAYEDFMKVGDDKLPAPAPGSNISWHYWKLAIAGLFEGNNILRNAVTSLGFGVLLVTPTDSFNPWTFLREGRYIPWQVLINTIIRMTFFGSVILLGTGLLLFRKREIATAQK